MNAVLTRTVALAGALGLAVTMAACTSDTPEPVKSSEPTPSESAAAPAVTMPKPGDCLAASTENPVTGKIDADLTSVVDCSEPALYLVYAVVDIPEDILTDDPSKDYITIQSSDTSENVYYQEWRSTRCDLDLFYSIGLDTVTFEGGVNALDVAERLDGFTFPDASIANPEQWAAGYHQVVCSVGFSSADEVPTKVTLGSGVVAADVITSNWPSELRKCWNYETWSSVACEEPHWAQWVLAIDAAALLGEDLDGIKRKADGSLNEDDYYRLDEICEAIVPWATGASDPTKYRGVGDPGGSGWGEEGLSILYCGVTIADSADYDVIGNLIGIGDAEPERVKVG